MAEIVLKRFHRGPTEWRQYSWRDHIRHHNGCGKPYYEIKPLLNTKNSKRKHKKHNRKLQSIYAVKGTRLYRILEIYQEVVMDKYTSLLSNFLYTLE